MVGVMNTVVTLAVIWVTLRFCFGISGEDKASIFESTAVNLLGFAAGLVNSFLFNRRWVFRSKGRWKPELLRFMLVFWVCYIPQLVLVNLLNELIDTNRLFFFGFGLNVSFVSQIAGNVFYTVLNFLLNKYYTFR
jgi:putative flippase GtrA